MYSASSRSSSSEEDDYNTAYVNEKTILPMMDFRKYKNMLILPLKLMMKGQIIFLFMLADHIKMGCK